MNMSEPNQFLVPQPGLLRGALQADESMAAHVSWRAGGPARYAYVPADTADLAAFIALVPASMPIAFVGLGSNLLVRDGGFPGVVVLMHRIHAEMRVDADLVFAAAGVANPKVARFAANQGFEGAEFLAGIPGTVGGALAMNAGCYGAETWSYVERVRTIDRRGRLHERTPADYEIAYRHCVRLGQHDAADDEFFVDAWFRFPRGDRLRARARIKELLSQRATTQPLTLPNAGSVFRNPPGDYAARLIDAAGLKGFAIGGARISEKHANFIVNPGGRGSAADIEALIHHASAVVRERFGVALVPEVRILGVAAARQEAA